MKDLSEYIISKGTPVYNGIVEGIAVIIESSTDFSKLDNNSEKKILIVENFNPNYDLILNKCAGAISEIGNILCHLAIVSRIRKIPAIVNTGETISKLVDGCPLTLDAYNGILYKGFHLDCLSEASNQNLLQKIFKDP